MEGCRRRGLTNRGRYGGDRMGSTAGTEGFRWLSVWSMEKAKEWAQEWAAPMLAVAALIGLFLALLHRSEDRIDAIDIRLTRLETQMEVLPRLEAKMGTLEAKMEGLDVRFAKMEAKLDLLLTGLDITVAPRQAE